jgi:hypothetical protein
MINKKRSTIDNPFAKAGIEKRKVSINFWRPLNLLNILKSLVTLKTLKILAICGNIEIAEELPVFNPVYDMIISRILAMTTKKSNTFHPDRKYDLPSAKNLSTN